MLSRLGIDASPAVQYVVAFAVIFGVLALLALGVRRLTGSRGGVAAQDRGRARQPRLGIVDVYDLDRQRQLILLRRDNVEHLLLIGGPNDVVVETNILRVPARGAAPGESGFDRAEHGGEGHTRPVVEPPRPSLEAAPPARLGSFAGPGEDASETQEELAPIGTTMQQPARARIEPVLKPDAVAPAPARPAPLAAPVRAAEPRRPDAGERTPSAAAPAPDPSVLTDMAKQLEQALRRPAPGAPAAPGADAAPAQPGQPEASRPVAPPARRVEAVRPAAPTRPVPPPRPAEAAPAPDLPETAPAAPPAAPEPAAPPVVAQAALPQAPAAPSPAPVPPPAAPSAPAPARAGASDPFSVEEIEAEFARLLGRPLDKADNR